jgi:L-serine dehydratase
MIPSVFEMLKVGIGPSSSHTLGPWRGAARFVRRLQDSDGGSRWESVATVAVDLYGSLALTGRGHGTDIALMMGLSGDDPVTVPIERVTELPRQITREESLMLGGERPVTFVPDRDIRYHAQERLPFHANGMVFTALDSDDGVIETATIYSVGGGFVVEEGEESGNGAVEVPHPIATGENLLRYCREQGLPIAGIVRENERVRRSDTEIDTQLLEIWRVMREAVFRGCSTTGILPGGLEVSRRAAGILRRIVGDDLDSTSVDRWMERVAGTPRDFPRILKLVGTFAIAVNEENAAFGRIVTAPTNGSAGVIPAVLMYYQLFSGGRDGNGLVGDREIVDFLLVAGAIGGIFKHGATISAAMGGCQAEIGVSSAMAAGALTESLGGSPEQALMAAEIAMEHHLGLTCDPIGGLVQVPCIERNSMGAIKAITAAHIALEGDASLARVSLDDVVKTMWSTAQDMNARYKETSLGGLAVHVSVRLPEC